MARRGKYNRRRRSGRFSFLYKLLTFVVICGAIAVALSLFFKIETVRITGNSRYKDQQILEASGLQLGDNMFLMNKYNVAKNITSQLPYIESVQIRRQIPTTLQIDLTECTAPAAIKQDGKVWLLSGEGKVVDCLGLNVWEQYTQIVGLTLSDPQIGQTFCISEEQEALHTQFLSLLHFLEEKQMLGDTQSIDLSDVSILHLRYLDRFDVNLNWDADFDYKLDYLLAVVNRLEINETGTIDMTQEGKASFIPK